MIPNEWGTPNMVEDGLNPEMPLLSNGYGHRQHVWDLGSRKHPQALDLGEEPQMVFEPRPRPLKACGFAGVAVSTKNLSAPVWLWHRDNDR